MTQDKSPLKMSKEFNSLQRHIKPTYLLDSIRRLLFWDNATHMPQNAQTIRGEQVALLSEMIHSNLTSKEFKGLLGKCIDLESGEVKLTNIEEWEKAALREFHIEYSLSSKLPTEFVKEMSQVTSEAQQIWEKAKEASDFKVYLPSLKKIVELCRKKAEYYGYEQHPYDALLDTYEPGMTASKIKPVFDALKEKLIPLVREYHGKPDIDTHFLTQTYDVEKQKKYALSLLRKMGHAKENTTFDESAHPFCQEIHPSDIRLTTHIHEENPMPNIFATIHEGGHGLYHGGLPQKYYGTPLCQAASYGLDESQSRLYETIFARSRAFWEHEYPHMQQMFPENLQDVSLDHFYKAIHKQPLSLIRIHADELSYCLHVIFRFEIELGLMDGSIKVEDLPEIWNDKVEEYLGIRPKNDKEGVLQDIHWSFGGIGYFPTYAIGNIYAAQLYETFKETHPNFEEEVKKGEFGALSKWLKENIHQQGRMHLADDLVLKVTGQRLNPTAYLNYLTSKYT